MLEKLLKYLFNLSKIYYISHIWLCSTMYISFNKNIHQEFIARNIKVINKPYFFSIHLYTLFKHIFREC